MFREVTIHSFLIPGLLLVLLGCVPIFVVVDLALAHLGIYRRVWHPALFRASLFVVLFCLAGWATR
jgi:protein AaeX